MWEPRPLATLWASTACNRDIVTFLPFFYLPIYTYFFKIVSFLLALLLKHYVHVLFTPICATFPANYILLDVIVLIIPGVMYKLCKFLISLNTFTLFVLDVLPSITAPKCTQSTFSLRGDRLILKSTFQFALFRISSYKSVVKYNERKVTTKFVWFLFRWYRVQISIWRPAILTGILHDFAQLSQKNAGRPWKFPSTFLRINRSSSLHPTL
jgi:hypothetical protein